MKVNYVLMYGTPYLKYREFDTFEDISKFLVNKRIVNYSIFKKLEDKEEVEMIYRDNDIHYLEKEIERLSKEVTKYDEILCERNNEVDRLNNIINKAIEYIEENCSEHGNEESMWFYRTINADNVLNILKGVDKE